MWDLKKNNTNEPIYKTETNSQRINLRLPGNGWGRDKLGVWDGHVYIEVFKMGYPTKNDCIAQVTLLSTL